MRYRLAFSATLLTLVMAMSPASAAPAIFWTSDPVEPGQTALVLGGGFPAPPRVELALIPRADPGRPALASLVDQGPWTAVETLQASDRSVKFVLPPRWPLAQYAVRVGGSAETGTLNAPRVFWTQGDSGASASPGGWVRVTGKCLDFEEQSRVALVQGQRAVALELTLRSPWALHAPLPPDLPEGRYTVLTHNGLGGPSGWRSAGELAVQRAAWPWPETQFSVLDFGARPNDPEADNTEAFTSALERAGESGGVVFVPRGRYRLTGPLQIPPRVCLRGESRELSQLYWPDTDQPPPALLRGTNSFGVEELFLVSANFQAGILSDPGTVEGAGHVRLHRVRARFNEYVGVKDRDQVDARYKDRLADAVNLGGDNVQITECDLYSSGRALVLQAARNSYVAHNRLSNGRWGWYCVSGSDGLICEHNEIIGGDLMATGGGINCLGGYTASQRVYFSHNHLHTMYGWDGEAMTSDAGGGAYLGRIARAQGATLELAEDADWGNRSYAGGAVYVLDGTGAGQYRRLLSTAGRTIELDSPWQIPPDQTSLVSVTMLQRHYVIVGNRFEDATVAVQFYGISIEHICAGNTSARAGGFHALGMNYHGWQPSWFQLFVDNRIEEGNNVQGPYSGYPSRGDSHLALHGANPPDLTQPLNRAAVIRGNVLENQAYLEVNGSWQDVILEGNTVRRSELGINVQSGAVGVLLRDNHFEEVTETYRGLAEQSVAD